MITSPRMATYNNDWAQKVYLMIIDYKTKAT